MVSYPIICLARNPDNPTYNLLITMVRDGYFYALPLVGAAVLLAWLTSPGWAAAPLVVAAFFLWFFRDPERIIPETAGAVVSPADGKVTDISIIEVPGGRTRTRISIFLNVFDVHVNRAPVAGTISDVQYRRGQFRNAMGASSAEHNEQNIVSLEGSDGRVVFKQIAGLLARRIVFTKRVGDTVQRGERVGMIKFGSRVDVVLDAAAGVTVRVGDRVKGGSSVLAYSSAAALPSVAAGRHQSGEQP